MKKFILKICLPMFLGVVAPYGLFAQDECCPAPQAQACCEQPQQCCPPRMEAYCCPVTKYRMECYNKYRCVEEPYTVCRKCCRYCPKYYDKTCCRYVPQYYCERCCCYCPEYYTVNETRCRQKTICEPCYRCVPYTCYETRYRPCPQPQPCCPAPQQDACCQ